MISQNWFALMNSHNNQKGDREVWIHYTVITLIVPHTMAMC